MALNFIDRLLTVVVTATVTSAAWVVAGSTYFGGADEDTSSARQAEGQPSAVAPAPSASVVAAPEAEETDKMIVPVQGIETSQLSDTFTDSRAGGARLHDALDIMAPAGTPVIAAAPGTVEKLFLSDAGGKTIYIRTNDRETIHYYAHLRDYAPGLKEGEKVSRGERLGTVGSTGNANPATPHLHFAIMRTTPDAKWWEPSTAINPYPLLVEP